MPGSLSSPLGSWRYQGHTLASRGADNRREHCGRGPVELARSRRLLSVPWRRPAHHAYHRHRLQGHLRARREARRHAEAGRLLLPRFMQRRRRSSELCAQERARQALSRTTSGNTFLCSASCAQAEASRVRSREAQEDRGSPGWRRRGLARGAISSLPMEPDASELPARALSAGREYPDFRRVQIARTGVWTHDGLPYDARELDCFRIGKREGVWFLVNPVDGESQLNDNGHQSQRSAANITSWRYLLIESDHAEPFDWLAALVQMPLPISAIYYERRTIDSCSREGGCR